MDPLKFLHDNMIVVVLFFILVGGIIGLYYRDTLVSLKFTLPLALFLMLLKPMVYMDIKKAFTKVTKTKIQYLLLLTLFYLVIFPLLTLILMKLLLAAFPNVNVNIIAAIVILGLSPMASSAPAFVGIANGRVQLALVGVIWTFFLSLFVIPLYSSWFLNSVVRVPVGILLKSIGLYIILPLVIGQAIKYGVIAFNGERGLRALKRPLSYLSLLGLYWMVIEVFGINSKILLGMSWSMLGVLLLLYIYHIIRFGLAYFSGKWIGMPLDRRISLLYSASVNMTLSTALSIGIFGTIAGVGTILGGPLSEMVLMVLLASFMSKMAEKGESEKEAS